MYRNISIKFHDTILLWGVWKLKTKEKNTKDFPNSFILVYVYFINNFILEVIYYRNLQRFFNCIEEL